MYAILQDPMIMESKSHLRSLESEWNAYGAPHLNIQVNSCTQMKMLKSTPALVCWIPVETMAYFQMQFTLKITLPTCDLSSIHFVAGQFIASAGLHWPGNGSLQISSCVDLISVCLATSEGVPLSFSKWIELPGPMYGVRHFPCRLRIFRRCAVS